MLVSQEEFVAFLGEAADTPDADAMGALVAQVEALFVSECQRRDRPFQEAELGRVEEHDGTGGRTLWLDYNVTALTSLTLGYDPDDPDETLDVDDPAAVQWRVGSNRIRRLDGCFGEAGQPGYVHVTYDAAAYLPDDAKAAILRRAAAVWRNRGSEDASSERIGGAMVELVNGAPDAVWEAAVAAHRAVRV